MRPGRCGTWLVLRQAGIPFEAVRIPLTGPSRPQSWRRGRLPGMGTPLWRGPSGAPSSLQFGRFVPELQG